MSHAVINRQADTFDKSPRQERVEAEREASALARQWLKETGKYHPIFGQVNLRRPVHARCVEHVAGMLKRKQDIETVLANCSANIGLDPESLCAAAEKKLNRKTPRRATCARAEEETR